MIKTFDGFIDGTNDLFDACFKTFAQMAPEVRN